LYEAWSEPSHQASQPFQHQHQPYQPSPFQLGGGGFQQRFGGSAFNQQYPQPQQALDKGKGREINWDDQFDQYAKILGEHTGDADEGRTKEAESTVEAEKVDELEE
jgi:hypothetical protein